MKAPILLAIALIILVCSCKKGEPINSNLFGKWEMRRRYGGFIYPPDTSYAPGNGNIIQFNTDSTYMSYTDFKETSSGMFHIRKNADTIDHATYNIIYFATDSTFRSIIIVDNGTLTLKPLIPDLSTIDYQKISN
jgi:hypothetical protein